MVSVGRFMMYGLAIEGFGRLRPMSRGVKQSSLVQKAALRLSRSHLCYSRRLLATLMARRGALRLSVGPFALRTLEDFEGTALMAPALPLRCSADVTVPSRVLIDSEVATLKEKTAATRKFRTLEMWGRGVFVEGAPSIISNPSGQAVGRGDPKMTRPGAFRWRWERGNDSRRTSSSPTQTPTAGPQQSAPPWT